MKNSQQPNKITFVLGPTASGKSRWALREALKTSGAILNADSVQIYKSLSIGAAKPTTEDQALVPHYLYDLAEPGEDFTAGDYRRAALDVIERELPHRPLYIVGGSGFYIQALEKGMYDVGPISPEIKKQVQQWVDSGGLYEELVKLDPEAAKKIGPKDPYRLQRALEVVMSEGRTMQKIAEDFRHDHRELKEQYDVEKIGIFCPRDVLRQRVTRRTEQMLKSGFIEEVQNLLGQGLADTKALRSVGYKECVAVLTGRLNRADLLSAIVTSTMQLAKRQMTWFKRDHEIHWIEQADL